MGFGGLIHRVEFPIMTAIIIGLRDIPERSTVYHLATGSDRLFIDRSDVLR